jgi:hypothetical protein
LEHKVIEEGFSDGSGRSYRHIGRRRRRRMLKKHCSAGTISDYGSKQCQYDKRMEGCTLNMSRLTKKMVIKEAKDLT